MNETELNKRKTISRLMREAASAFNEQGQPNLEPALPKMQMAVTLAASLEDKVPLIICETHLASMNAMAGVPEQAFRHLDRALRLTADTEVPTAIRNYAFTKFIEVAVQTGEEQGRALAFAQALTQATAGPAGSYPQFLAALFNLAVVCYDLFDDKESALAILSWIQENTMNPDERIAQQAGVFYTKIQQKLPVEDRGATLSGIEANRDVYLSNVTNGILPDRAPFPENADDPFGDEHPGLEGF